MSAEMAAVVDCKAGLSYVYVKLTTGTNQEYLKKRSQTIKKKYMKTILIG